MNCDQVFDILTRGPFPAGTADDIHVERHLAVCHECRQLAEALRPAVELFHEAIDPRAGRDLPGYRGSLSPSRSRSASLPSAVEAALGVVVLAGRSTPRRKAKRAASFPGGVPWGLVGASVVLGLGLGVLVWAMGVSHQPLSRQLAQAPPPATASEDAPLPAARRLVVAGLHMTSVCLNLPGGNSPLREQPEAQTALSASSASRHSADLAQLACCTRCHAAKSGVRTPAAAIASVSGSCQACHTAN